jgi:large subunit ribosomal protein L9
MKIILLEDIKKHGKKGDIINVKDGYGSFLIKDKKAVLATSGGLNRLDRENKSREEAEKKLIADCEKTKKMIEKEKLQFKVKVGVQDKVFGSISAKQIADKLSKYNINKKQIKIISPLSSLGFHEVSIELHKKVVAHIKVELVK